MTDPDFVTIDEAAWIPPKLFGGLGVTPVDDMWCDICGEEPQTGITQDGVGACTGCMLIVLDKIAESQGAVLIGPNRKQRRALEKAARKGMTKRAPRRKKKR